MKNVHTNAGVQKLLHNLLLRISIFPALSRSEGEKRRCPGNEADTVSQYVTLLTSNFIKNSKERVI